MLYVYVGTYTGGKSQGIYLFRMDPNTGALTPAGVAASGIVNPSFLAPHPNGRFLYAVSEIGNFNGEQAGGVAAFARDPKDGRLTLLNQQSSRGGGPCHLTLDRKGKNVIVANYGGGSVACLPVGRDGRLSPATAFVQHQGKSVHPERQKGPNAHSVHVDANNRYVVAADLGLDKLLVYRLDTAKGTLTPNDPPATATTPGAGPRQFAFHPTAPYGYVANELNSTLTAFRYDAGRGVLTEMQTVSLLPDGFSGNNSPAEVQVHPSGRYVYASNRGHDSIAAFAVDAATGKLRSLGHTSIQGKSPRHFGLTPSGRFLVTANERSDALVVFRIEEQTGKLQPTGHTVEVPIPVCVSFVETR